MDLSSLNKSLNVISNKITTYLDKPAKIDFATFEQQQDTIYVSNKYNDIVTEYSNLLNLITEIQYYISQCKKVIRLISDNSGLERAQKAQIKTTIDLVEEMSQPLYNEKERLKTIEMFYRNVYTRKDF